MFVDFICSDRGEQGRAERSSIVAARRQTSWFFIQIEALEPEIWYFWTSCMLKHMLTSSSTVVKSSFWISLKPFSFSNTNKY